jgi:hypothetical protein
MLRAKAIRVTGRADIQVCKMYGLSHYVEIGSLMAVKWSSASAALYPQEENWYLFLLETESTAGP